MIRTSYDAVADKYAREFFDELSRKPFDCALLEAFAAACEGGGKVLDVGCGPGHVARYLSQRGVDTAGLDLSPVTVDLARHLNPDLEFSTGDMRALEIPPSTLSGLVAFYSIIHIPRMEVPLALGEFHRVLNPGGRLLLSVHGGTGVVHRDEFLGEAVPFEATLFSLGEIVSLVESAGFWVDEARQRKPYEFEHQTLRIYVIAHRED